MEWRRSFFLLTLETRESSSNPWSNPALRKKTSSVQPVQEFANQGHRISIKLWHLIKLVITQSVPYRPIVLHHKNCGATPSTVWVSSIPANSFWIIQATFKQPVVPRMHHHPRADLKMELYDSGATGPGANCVCICFLSGPEHTEFKILLVLDLPHSFL